MPSSPVNPWYTALVLMGGGARTAYQAGVLRALGQMLDRDRHDGRFPFQMLVGTSAGALNAAYLAQGAGQGLGALDALARFWGEIRSSQVYRLRVPEWMRASRWLTALQLAREVRRQGAFLDNTPLVDTLHRAISLPGIERALRDGTLLALAVTASSYSSGVHWTFCQTAREEAFDSWSRPGRRAEFQPITIEHLVASSAIPFIFSATPLWVDGRREFFGDGSMRQLAPLSPALHLGADRVLVIGVGQPERSGFAVSTAPQAPKMGVVAGYTMASVFHDTLAADMEQTRRINTALRLVPREIGHALHYRPVDVLAIQPSQSLDALALAYAYELPGATRRTLAGMGALQGDGAILASYLLFEPGFVGALIELGERDAQAREAELRAFFSRRRGDA